MAFATFLETGAFDDYLKMAFDLYAYWMFRGTQLEGIDTGLAGLEGETARMTSVDRLGFQVVVTSAERVRGARIPFDREVRSPGEARAVLVEMVRRERAANG